MNETMIEALSTLLKEEEYTAYGLSRVLNGIREANGLNPVRPQMMYNYLRNGLVVPKEKIFGDNLRKVTRAEAAAFILKYAQKHSLNIVVLSKGATEVVENEDSTGPEVVEVKTDEVEAELTEDDVEFIQQ